MASVLALCAAFLFALAAALQQKGALGLPEISLRHPSSLARLAGQTPSAATVSVANPVSAFCSASSCSTSG